MSTELSAARHSFAPHAPRKIQEAHSRIARHPAFRGRAGVLGIVLNHLAQFTPLQAVEAPVRFARDTLARYIGVDTRTVDRRLAALERQGFIERLPRAKRADGTWELCRIRWTTAGLELLGWTPAQQHPRPNPSSCANRATDLAHKVLYSSPSEKEQKGARANSAQGASNPPNPQRARIPADLRDAADRLQLSTAQVAELMKRAKARGKWLQDVVNYVLDRMLDQGIHQGRAFKYLDRCLEANVDYRWLLKRIRRDQGAKARQQRHARLAERVVQALQPGRRLPGYPVIKTVEHGFVQFIDGSSVPSGEFCRQLFRDPWSVRALLRGRTPPTQDTANVHAVNAPPSEGPASASKRPEGPVDRAGFEVAWAALRRAARARSFGGDPIGRCADANPSASISSALG